ncbi:MAG: HemK2/MTQ2 family protein methyltransferase [Flavisolibacter sp.]
MKDILKYIVARTYRPLLVKYLSGTRSYTYKGIELEVPPQVFHPGFFFSTKLLLRHIKHENLKQKTLLELGAGSGLISVYAAQKGAKVTATDINPFSILCLKKNAPKNKVELNIIHSDLFDKIPATKFDRILINPPYYKKKPSSDAEYAWYCGEGGEYFQKLFGVLSSYMHSGSEVSMILCDGCDIEMVENFCSRNHFRMECVYTKKSLLETNYIFKIVFTK